MQGHCKTRAATVPDMHRHSHRTRRVAGLFSHKSHTPLPTQGTQTHACDTLRDHGKDT